MELPDCPPGAEGYQDTVIEVPRKQQEATNCTKAEQEFQEHLNSLKIKTEDGNYRCMVERRGRDVSGKWIYLCYPCAAMCSGESVLQTHISGKKHKSKLSMKSIWPVKIFDSHPYVQSERGNVKNVVATDIVLQKMAEEVENFKRDGTVLDLKYDKYRDIPCHIQEILDNVKAPLIGIEYLIEHPPEEDHYEPSYICVLCIKHGHPRTIVNHLTCFWHRYNYLLRHFSKATSLLSPYRNQTKYREGVAVIMNRLAARVEDKYGRMKPINIEKEEYERDKDHIHQWIFRGPHYSETDKCTFEEMVDADLITSLDSTKIRGRKNHDPSPPVVAAPSKPVPNYRQRRGIKRGSMDSLSDVSDEYEVRVVQPKLTKGNDSKRNEQTLHPDKRRASPNRIYLASRNVPSKSQEKQVRAPNYDYKVKLAQEQRQSAEDLALKALAYHEKNPEKHPLYPEEWRKFWNRRYKEIQAEGKDASKHDFKPEWIVFWTARMKELHEEELRAAVSEIYRRMRLTPPPPAPPPQPNDRKSPERRRSADRRRSPRRRSPDPRRRSPRRASPLSRRSDPKNRSTDRRSPPRRSPARRSSPRRASPRRLTPRRRSPLRHLRTRSRSPVHKPRKSTRSPARREVATHAASPRSAFPDTVLISDEEFKPEDSLSSWNSADSIASLPDARSPPKRRSRTGSTAPRRGDGYRGHDRDRERERGHGHGHDRDRIAPPQDFGAAENVVATLRLLVALEDYLGSLGPKIVDLLAEALKMEKDKANSSEELLETEAAVVLIETAKEKLKGAVQAGLVTGSAAHAVRTAVVRAAATLHEADTRIKKRKMQTATSGSILNASTSKAGSSSVPVAGVGAVDRELIAQQMAAALIAQGKTDVSADELAQLVDAVVGMAEAKKREEESKKKSAERAAAAHGARLSGTASALQMLQSAYDDKNKTEKEDIPDAMDGLSDSDLETLLKNFNELSAEEQHSLIAYLKKLEAREPLRVERLRQYVSAAATAAPVEEKPKPKIELKIPVTIESDDDDYTVEDIFKSATQKVKEDQIRQEMEIVKKSLEESKEIPKVTEAIEAPKTEAPKDIISASDLLALVQASLQSTPAPTPAQTSQTPLVADVVTSSVQPRSFGDLPEPPMTDISKQINTNISVGFNNQLVNPAGFMRNNQNFGTNQSENQHTPDWEQRQDPDFRGDVDSQHNNSTIVNQVAQRPQDIYNQGPKNFNSAGPLRGPQDNYNFGQRGKQDNFQSQNIRGIQDNYNQMQRVPQDGYDQGTRDTYDQDSQGSQGSYNQGIRAPQTNYNPNQRTQPNHFNQGQQQQNFNSGIRGQDNYNQGQRTQQDNFNQGQRTQQDNFNQGQRTQQDNQGQRGPQNNYNQGLRGPQNTYNAGQRQDNYNQRGPQNFIQNQENYSKLPSLLDGFNQNSRGQDQSIGGGRDTNNTFNQNRGNFVNRMPDNYNNNRQDGNQQHGNQKFGNYEQNNFRGRGRGFGGQRGRGRGYY